MFELSQSLQWTKMEQTLQIDHRDHLAIPIPDELVCEKNEWKNKQRSYNKNISDVSKQDIFLHSTFFVACFLMFKIRFHLLRICTQIVFWSRYIKQSIFKVKKTLIFPRIAYLKCVIWSQWHSTIAYSYEVPSGFPWEPIVDDLFWLYDVKFGLSGKLVESKEGDGIDMPRKWRQYFSEWNGTSADVVVPLLFTRWLLKI